MRQFSSVLWTCDVRRATCERHVHVSECTHNINTKVALSTCHFFFKTYDPPPTIVLVPLPPFVHKMLFLNTVAALALVAGTAVQAKNWDVAVGANGTVFDPPSITGAADADVVIFTLYVVSPYSPIPFPLSPYSPRLQQRRSPYRHSVDLCKPLLPAFRWCRLWPVSTLPSYTPLVLLQLTSPSTLQ